MHQTVYLERKRELEILFYTLIIDAHTNRPNLTV